MLYNLYKYVYVCIYTYKPKSVTPFSATYLESVFYQRHPQISLSSVSTSNFTRETEPTENYNLPQWISSRSPSNGACLEILSWKASARPFPYSLQWLLLMTLFPALKVVPATLQMKLMYFDLLSLWPVTSWNKGRMVTQQLCLSPLSFSLSSSW